MNNLNRFEIKQAKRSKLNVKLKPADFQKVNEFAEKFGIPTAIVAGKIADLGDSVLRNNSVAAAIGGASSLAASSAGHLWTIINRDKEDYSSDCEVLMDASDLYSKLIDCSKFKRSIEDWVATLIHVGLQIAVNSAATLCASSCSILLTTCQAHAYKVEKQQAYVERKGKKAVYLPAAFVDFLEDLMTVADISGTPDEYVADLLGGSLRPSVEPIRTTSEGRPIFDGAADEFINDWDHKDREEVASAMIEVIERHRDAVIAAASES